MNYFCSACFLRTYNTPDVTVGSGPDCVVGPRREMYDREHQVSSPGR